MANFRSILFVNNIINNILNVMMSLSICFNLRKLLPDGKGSINHAKQFGKVDVEDVPILCNRAGSCDYVRVCSGSIYSNSGISRARPDFDKILIPKKLLDVSQC
jgi:hypothetical protein